MKILVIGGGSMGRRRLRDLTYLNPGGVALFEPQPNRCKEVSESFEISGYTNLDDALNERPDAMVVSTPPALHETYVVRGVQDTRGVFSEVPFLLDYRKLKDVAKNAAPDVVLGVSHTIRYYPPFRLIKDIIDERTIGRTLYLEYSLGNYLPDWHPYEDYRKFYASKQSQGGAGMDMLLHELSAIQWWMGKIGKVQSRLAKVSALEISGPDCHDILLTFTSGAVGFFHHDVIERGTVGRHIRIVGEEGTLEWHQNQSSIRVYTGSDNRNVETSFDKARDWNDAIAASREAALLLSRQRSKSGQIPSAAAPSFTYESCYLREMRHFVNAVQGVSSYTMCGITEELNTVATFEAVLASAESGKELVVP